MSDTNEVNMDMLDKAIEIARKAHHGQKDKAGRDYIGHPLRVMAVGVTMEEKIVGVLHDVVEDSDVTFEMLSTEGFTNAITNALKCLTRRSDESYDDFIARVKGNRLATAVKLNDLTDNMDIRRLPYLSDKDVKRLKKYLKAYKRLSGEPVYSIYATRQEWCNAYQPWSEAEDSRLAQMWFSGIPTSSIAEDLHRKPSAVEVRAKKLKLKRE